MLGSSLVELLCVEIQRGEDDMAIRAVEEWAGLRESEPGELEGDAIKLFRLADEWKSDSHSIPQWREARVKSAHLLLIEQFREIARRPPESHEFLFILADMLSHAPEPIRNPELALKLAEKACALEPVNNMSWQSLGWARYRVGDWKGCIESVQRLDTYPRDGDFFAAMAYWQLGDRDRARTLFDQADTWLPGYERKCAERRRRQGTGFHPEPWMLRNVRAEAAELLGVNDSPMPVGEQDPPEAATNPDRPH